MNNASETLPFAPTPVKPFYIYGQQASTKHGCSRRGKLTPEYRAWCSIKRRCYNPRAAQYKDYGGRGITVCDRWLNSFESFLADMGLRPADNYSIERIKIGGNYEPSNCIWKTQKEQCRNKRNNIMVTIGGVTKSLVEWVENTSLSYGTVHSRVLAGWPSEMLLTNQKYLKGNRMKGSVRTYRKSA